MSRPRALRSDADIRRMVALATELRLPIAALDVGTDHIKISCVAPDPARAGSAFDDWVAGQEQKGEGGDRPAHRRQ